MKYKPFEKNSNSSHYNDWENKRVCKYINEFTNKISKKVKFIITMPVKKYGYPKTVNTLREAKLFVDKKLIEKGEEPIYILKRKI